MRMSRLEPPLALALALALALPALLVVSDFRMK